jgi:hypothetical protein
MTLHNPSLYHFDPFGPRHHFFSKKFGKYHSNYNMNQLFYKINNYKDSNDVVTLQFGMMKHEMGITRNYGQK